MGDPAEENDPPPESIYFSQKLLRLSTRKCLNFFWRVFWGRERQNVGSQAKQAKPILSPLLDPAVVCA